MKTEVLNPERTETKVKTEMDGWQAIEWRYGLCRFVREDGSEIYPFLTAGGNVKWNARHARWGLAASDRGYAKPFSSARSAEKWIKLQDERR